MKGKLGFFIFGLFVGAVLTVFAFIIYSVGIQKFLPSGGTEVVSTNNQSNQIDGLTLFDSDGATIPAVQLRVFQTLGSNYALAEIASEKVYDTVLYGNSVAALLVNDGDYSIYDDLRIDITGTKKVVQIGTYRYQTVDKQWKTVPVVKIK